MTIYRNADGSECCGGDKWYGRLCPYHEGYEDGLDDAQALRSQRDELRVEVERWNGRANYQAKLHIHVRAQRDQLADALRLFVTYETRGVPHGVWERARDALAQLDKNEEQ